MVLLVFHGFLMFMSCFLDGFVGDVFLFQMPFFVFFWLSFLIFRC